MTTIIATGFETNDMYTVDQTRGYPGPTLDSDTPGDWSNYSLKIKGGDVGANQGAAAWLIPNKSELVFGFHYKQDGGGSGLLRFYDIADNVLDEAYLNTATGVMEMYREDTNHLLDTSDLQTVPNRWYWISGRILVGDSGEFQIYVDDVLFCSYSGDTQSGANQGIYKMQVYTASGAGGNCYYDDLWVVDKTGEHSGLVDKMDQIGIFALNPNGVGDQSQWTAHPSTSQRFYFPSSLPSDHPLECSVPTDTSWEVGRSNPFVGVLTPQKFGTAQYRRYLDAIWVTDNDILLAQFISDPLAPQTISGTVKGQIRPKEDYDMDLRGQVVIRVVSHDGQTVRGTLYAGDTGALASEWNQSTGQYYVNRKITPRSPLTLSSVTAQDGDRIVVEIGARAHKNWTPNANAANLMLGDDSATDLPEDETTTDNYNPWIEFSNVITFANWATVDDIPYDDDDTYVEESTTDERDLYNFDDLGSALTDVKCVIVRMRARLTEPGPGKIAIDIKSGGTESAGSDLPLGPPYAWVSRVMDVDPTDSQAWTRTKVNNLQVGPKVR